MCCIGGAVKLSIDEKWWFATILTTMPSWTFEYLELLVHLPPLVSKFGHTILSEILFPYSYYFPIGNGYGLFYFLLDSGRGRSKIFRPSLGIRIRKTLFSIMFNKLEFVYIQTLVFYNQSLYTYKIQFLNWSFA